MNQFKYILLILVLVSFTTSCGGGGGGDDGGSTDVPLANDACDSLGLKIFSGTQCTLESTTPVVAFNIRSIDGTLGLCTGNMISTRHVLTAGHCFPAKGSLVSSVSVAVGGALVSPSGIFIHPQYEERLDLAAIFNDVAILELPADVAVTPLPILLSRAPQVNDIIDIFGFGLDEAGGVGKLKSGQMVLSDVTDTHLFAVFGSTGSNTCLGDSGGPALMRNQVGAVGVIGLTSTGTPEALCERGDVSLFANLQNDSVLDFIIERVPEISGI